ncbi:MAG: hypothetical protein ACRDJM_06730 [Actinomycetota bacterium]
MKAITKSAAIRSRKAHRVDQSIGDPKAVLADAEHDTTAGAVQSDYLVHGVCYRIPSPLVIEPLVIVAPAGIRSVVEPGLLRSFSGSREGSHDGSEIAPFTVCHMGYLHSPAALITETRYYNQYEHLEAVGASARTTGSRCASGCGSAGRCFTADS